MTPSHVNDSNDSGFTRKRCVQSPGKQRIQDETRRSMQGIRWEEVQEERVQVP